MRKGITGPRLAGYIVFVVLVAVIAILIMQGGLSGAGDYIRSAMDAAVGRPVELLNDFFN